MNIMIRVYCTYTYYSYIKYLEMAQTYSYIIVQLKVQLYDSATSSALLLRLASPSLTAMLRVHGENMVDFSPPGPPHFRWLRGPQHCPCQWYTARVGASNLGRDELSRGPTSRLQSVNVNP